MTTQRIDPAQEFAERVAKLWYSANLAPQKLSAFIANQLRAEGWKPNWMIVEREAGR